MESHSKNVQRSLSANEVSFDLANTHQSNQELRQCENVKTFFARAATVGSLKDDDTREWVGSLPNTMPNLAVPMFTDDDGNDFQIHFSYTWMSALHTAGTKDANFVDPCVHRLLHVTDSDDLKVIEHPEIVVPIGKLFINKYNHSIWTGYEVFVCVNMKLWIVYNLDEFDPQELYPEEVRLSKWDLPGCKEEGDDEIGEPPIMRFSCLWDSLKTVESATSLRAESFIRQSSIRDYGGTFCLLELLETEASRAIQFSDRLVHTNFATEKFTVDAASGAGHELLILANKNAKTPIMKLTFDESAQSIEDCSRSLLSLAIIHEDESIINFILARGNVDVDLKVKLGGRPLSYVLQLALKHAVGSAALEVSVPIDGGDLSIRARRNLRNFASFQAEYHAIKYTAKYAVLPNLMRAASFQVSAAVFFAVYLVYRKAGRELGEEVGRETAKIAGTLAAAAIEKTANYNATLQVFLKGELPERDINILPQSTQILAVQKVVVDAITAATGKLNLTEIVAGETRPRDPLVWVSDTTRTQALNDILQMARLYAALFTKKEIWEHESDLLVKLLKRYQDTSSVTTSTAEES